MPRKRNTDPGVYPYPVEGGKRWGAVVSLPKDPRTGKRLQRRKQGFATKAEALAWKRAELARRDQHLPDGRQLLNNYLDDWLLSLVALTPGTRRSYRTKLVPVRDKMGLLPIGKITPVVIEQFNADRIRSGHSASGVHETHRVFLRAMRRAHHLGLIAANPFERIRAPKRPRHEVTTWTIDDAHVFLERCGDDPIWGDLWHVLIRTWMRVGEVTDLRWGDVDFTSGAIHVTHAVARNDELVMVSGDTKTAKSRRVIQIDDDLLQRLRKRRIRAFTSDDEDLIFPPPMGTGFLKASAVSRALKRSCRNAGVPVLTTHELRHNGGSLAYMDGVDIAAISERMGHASIAITWSIYTHLNEQHHKAVARQIGALFARDVTSDQESAADSA